MSLSDTFENDLAKLIFQAVAISNIADNASGSPLTSLYISLHKSDPGDAGTQTTNEADYTGYSRKAVLRSSSGFGVSGNQISVVPDVTFDPCTGGSNSIQFAAIGVASGGSSKILVSGPLPTPLGVTSGVAPTIPAGTVIGSFD